MLKGVRIRRKDIHMTKKPITTVNIWAADAWRPLYRTWLSCKAAQQPKMKRLTTDVIRVNPVNIT